MTKPKKPNVPKFRQTYPLFGMADVLMRAQENIVSHTPVELTPAQWRILAVLTEQDWQSMGELASRTVIERTALNHALNRLETSGWVARRRGKIDGRVTEAALTKEGWKTFRSCAPVAKRELDKMLDGLSVTEIRRLFTSLGRMQKNLTSSDDG